MIDRILIADDHSIVRYGLSRVLQRLRPNATIEEADTFRSVLDMIRTHTFDLIFLDVNMPDGNFQQTFDIVKAKQPNMKIIIFSAQEEHIYAIRYLKMGANGFLPKTADEETIRKAMDAILQQKNYFSDLIHDTLIFNSLNKTPKHFDTVASLSDRELEIANMLVKGLGLKAISNNMNIHVSTVSTYKVRIFKKLAVDSIPQLIEVMKFNSDQNRVL
jgi:DNA-binding NarL/FixJ family response regulator